jgi:hypothetical protein
MHAQIKKTLLAAMSIAMLGAVLTPVAQADAFSTSQKPFVNSGEAGHDHDDKCEKDEHGKCKAAH